MSLRTFAASLLLVSASLAAQSFPKTLVIGFVGGRVHANASVHLEVKMAAELRRLYPKRAEVHVFANHDGAQALVVVKKFVDANHDNALDANELREARVIVYGHSWGASQTVTLAEQMQKLKVPVMLTVQVDSVQKVTNQDRVIPSNVEQAINFYQENGLLSGRKEIVAADAKRTQILGNFRSDYSHNKIDCHEYPWFARTFMYPHIEIENDARVWNRIQSMIEERIEARAPVATVNTMASR